MVTNQWLLHSRRGNHDGLYVQSFLLLLLCLSFFLSFSRKKFHYFTISRALVGNIKKMATSFQLIWLGLFIKNPLHLNDQ